VLDYVERRDHVERVACKGQVVDVALPNIVESSLSAEVERFVTDVHPFGMSQRSQLLEQVSSATPGVKDRQVVAALVPLTYPVEHDGSAC
jgi:hypothetical protein